MRRIVQRARTRGTEDGFTLVEVIVAMFIVVLIMTALLGALVSSLETVSQARHRQTATALATQALERLRALPYNQVTQPDGSAPEAGLQYAVVNGTGYDFEPVGLIPGVDEPLVVNQLSARWEDQSVGEVTYRIQTYVTRPAATAGGSQTFNLFAVVSWTSATDQGTRRVVERSTTFSPSGCLSTAQSPFAAPCQSYVTAQAGQSLGGVTITNEADAKAMIPGFEDTRLFELTLSANSTSLLVEQTATANAGATTSGVRRVGATEAENGSASAAVSVDSDPSSTPDQEETATASGHSSSALQATGTAGRLVGRAAGSDGGEVRAAINGSSTYCLTTSGAGFATGAAGALHPCASSRVQPGSTASSIVFEPEGTLGFGSLTVPMVSIGNTGTSFRSVSAQLTAPSTTGCTNGIGAGTLGCGYAESSRSLGAVAVGSSTGASATPSGWVSGKPIWQITGLAETLRTEEGSGARVPAYSRSGQLEVWDGTAFRTIDLSCYSLTVTCASPDAGTSRTIAVPPTTISYSGGGGQLTVTYEGAVTVQRPTATRTPATRTGNVVTDCKTEACVSQVNGGSAVVGNLTVVVARNGTEIGRYALSTNLGGLVSQTSYKAAANA